MSGLWAEGSDVSRSEDKAHSVVDWDKTQIWADCGKDLLHLCQTRATSVPDSSVIWAEHCQWQGNSPFGPN